MNTTTTHHLLDGSALNEQQERAFTWLESYDGDFGFLRDMRRQQVADRPFTLRQMDAIVRCYGNEMKRQEQANEQRQEQPRRGPAAEGWYITDSERAIYKVQKAVHGSRRNYAKRLEQQDDGTWTWVYAPGMVYQLGNARKLTLEEAQEFGKLYGVCCCCGATLTDEESIAAGIGPICGGRLVAWLREA